MIPCGRKVIYTKYMAESTKFGKGGGGDKTKKIVIYSIAL